MSAPAKTRMKPEDYDWEKAEFELMRLDRHYSELAGRDIDFIVLHHMTIPGTGTGSALVACYNVWMSRKASAHYGVDGPYVAQYVWDKDFAWATGSNTGNLHGLSIEMANRRTGPTWEISEITWKTAAKLAAHLHVLYKLGRPVSGRTLRKHSAFTSTACPGPYADRIWAQIVAEAQRVYDAITKKPSTPTTPKPTQPSGTWTVKGGDTLWKIASETGATVDQIAAWNGIPKPYIIKPGDVLLLEKKEIPKPPAKTETLELMFLPMPGYNADNARGVTQWKRNTDGLAKMLTEENPDLFATTELSNKGINPMKPRFEKATPNHQLEHGSDGRYVGRNTKTMKHVGGGVITTSEEVELNGDDKQAAWSVDITPGGTRVGTIVVHTENQDGVDKKSGKNADNLRVDQTFYLLNRAIKKCRALGVKDEHIIIPGDFNSVGMVKDAMIARGGWTPIGPGYFTRWDDSAKLTFDWVFIKKPGTANSRRINHDFGDHTALVITWTFPV